MKKISVLILLLFITSLAVSQEKEEKYPQDTNKKHELKLNVFNLIVLSSMNVSYEYLLNKDASFGIDAFYNFNSIKSDFYYAKKFSLTPYYRWFFSDTKLARGFFVEGFGMLNTFEDEIYYFGSQSQTETVTDFALGVSVGGKFITKSNFTAEVFLGVGRNLFNNNNNDNYNNYSIVSRGGISLGYRF